MREGQFIKKNLGRWDNYQEQTEDPDEIARRFAYLIDDLAYAKTFYPKSNTVRFINGLAANIYLSIYRNKRVKNSRLLAFWVTDLPLIIRRNHDVMLLSFVIFFASVLLGAISAKVDQQLVRSVLGDAYVSMTEANINSGKPFNVYAQQNELIMFLEIAYNNISVAFMTYLFGMSFGILTIWSLFNNGLMLGVFEYMFFKHSLGFKSILVVFVHGTLEIWSIVVAGACGLMLARALFFPGTYSVGQALRKSAIESVQMVISLVPSFIVAAFFEGFVTRHTEMPVAMSLSILGASVVFIVWYYIFYPIKVTRRLANAPK